MDFDLRALVGGEMTDRLPETPHELPYDRAKVDALLVRVKEGEQIDLLTELLHCVDWRAAFVEDDGQPITLEDMTRLIAYYRAKWSDIGPIYIADLLSTEFMTEQRARGDIVFSERLLRLGREEPQLWQEIRQFFRRKEFATAMLAMAHAARRAERPPKSEDDTGPRLRLLKPDES
jgi:hypothetical protein